MNYVSNVKNQIMTIFEKIDENAFKKNYMYKLILIYKKLIYFMFLFSFSHFL